MEVNFFSIDKASVMLFLIGGAVLPVREMRGRNEF